MLAPPPNPQGALDEMPPGRDRRRGDQGPDRLSAEYVRATNDFLVAAGVAPQDVDQINEILGAYVDTAEEQATSQTRAAVQWPAGEAQDRAYAYDAFGNRRPRLRSMNERERDSFAERFPGAAKIKVM